MRYVVEGKLKKTQFSGFFLERETHEDLLPLASYLNDVFDFIPQHAKVSIAIDWENDWESA